MSERQGRALMLAGVPAVNQALYHRVRFLVGDAAAYLEWPDRNGARRSLLLVRDIEMQRARQHARAERIGCSVDFAPQEPLSADRDTALAQAAAECFRRAAVSHVIADRSMPFIFVWHLQQAGITVEYDAELGVRERRTKDEQELAWMREAQATTEEVMEMACRCVARSKAAHDGVLFWEGAPLTSERLRAMISVFLLDRGYSNHNDSIIATVPHAADCHHHGAGPLRTGLPVIVDIFPRNNATRYWGDCTRTVVHGQPSDELVRMHRAVVEAKAAASAALRPGATGAEVHAAATQVITQHGYAMGSAPADADPSYTSMQHGTGHGIGLDVHEGILLDQGAGEILPGEVFTVEPGLYSRQFGGVRVEDMVAAMPDGPQNFNRLHEGLEW